VECSLVVGADSNFICPGKHRLLQRCDKGGNHRVESRRRWSVLREGLWNWERLFGIEFPYLSECIWKPTGRAHWTISHAERMWKVGNLLQTGVI